MTTHPRVTSRDTPGLPLAHATPATATEERLKRLQAHLDQENNILLQIVKSFRQLDKVAYRLGLLTRTQSFHHLGAVVAAHIGGRHVLFREVHVYQPLSRHGAATYR